ncbi:uncharacterized protein LOC108677954, partial [Hyalella azteca]|uniref:Uncharacterized protein LOC108677954 n=1 Tax=Hyalella azteca TaxID=294128 RepID=A0A8B7P9B1_HYAAZ
MNFLENCSRKSARQTAIIAVFWFMQFAIQRGSSVQEGRLWTTFTGSGQISKGPGNTAAEALVKWPVNNRLGPNTVPRGSYTTLLSLQNQTGGFTSLVNMTSNVNINDVEVNMDENDGTWRRPIAGVRELRASASQDNRFVSKNNSVVTAQVASTAILHCRTSSATGGLVSWIRKRDYQLLTVGLKTHSMDDRFTINYVHWDWQLHIRYVQPRDAGTYECQVSS